MKDEIFNKMLELAKRDRNDDSDYTIFTTEDQNEQWLIPMITKRFEDCSSFNPDLLSVEKNRHCEYDEDGEEYTDYDGYDVAGILAGIYEVKIFYDGIDITKFITGELEFPGCPSPEDGGFIGLAYKELSCNIANEYILRGERENFEFWAEEGDLYVDEEDLTLSCDDAIESVNREIKEELAKNVFTICEYCGFADLEPPYDEAQEEYTKYLIDNGYIER